MPLEHLLHRAISGRSALKSPLMDGYAARATWAANDGNSIRTLKATWRVPAPPMSHSGQTIYLFIGMETAVGDRTILQPVLQWGVNGLKNWSVASYCVSGSPGNLKFAAATKAIPVSSGQHLTASITLQTNTDGIFGYLSEFEGLAETVLHINLPQELTQVGTALEVYNVMKLSDLPNSDTTRLAPIVIRLFDDARVSPVWEITNSELKYNVRAVAVPHDGVQDEIDIFYR